MKSRVHSVIIALAVMVCMTVTEIFAAEPLIVAHRGASHDAPENTLAAFRLAWEQAADAIEGDFYLTKDRHIVCIHDATTKRTSGKDLKVADSTLEALRALDVGSWKDAKWAGEGIPTLEEVLACVPRGKKILMEVKCGPEIVPLLKEALAKVRLGSDQAIIIAFDPQVITEAKRQMPGIQALWLTGYKRNTESGQWKPGTTDILETLKRIGADGLDSEAHASVDGARARALRQAGYSLHVWTIDQPETAARFAKLSVVSITTNRPRWLRDEMRRLLADSADGRSVPNQ